MRLGQAARPLDHAHLALFSRAEFNGHVQVRDEADGSQGRSLMQESVEGGESESSKLLGEQERNTVQPNIETKSILPPDATLPTL